MFPIELLNSSVSAKEKKNEILTVNRCKCYFLREKFERVCYVIDGLTMLQCKKKKKFRKS
jgi:hypothetical protein